MTKVRKFDYPFSLAMMIVFAQVISVGYSEVALVDCLLLAGIPGLATCYSIFSSSYSDERRSLTQALSISKFWYMCLMLCSGVCLVILVRVLNGTSGLKLISPALSFLAIFGICFQAFFMNYKFSHPLASSSWLLFSVFSMIEKWY